MKAGWTNSTLGEACELYQPKTITKKEMDDAAPYAVFGANGVIGQYHDFNHRERQLIIGCRGACGTVHVTEPFSWITGNSMVVRPRDNKLDLEFLKYFLLGPADLQSVVTGAAQPQITRQSLAPVLAPLPPLEEQRRIVAILDGAFEGLARAKANAEANLASAEEFFASAIEAALRDAGGERRTLQQLIDDGSITSHLDGNHGSNYPRKDEFVNRGVPYISANCITGTQIDLGRAKYLSAERAGALTKGIARNRDVLFAHNATVGPVALLETSEDRVILSTSLTYYRCDETMIIPEYLVCEMRSASFTRQYREVMGQATRNQVPITAQRKFYHTIPSLQAQREVAELGVALDQSTMALLASYQRSVADLDQLRQSLLQKAFAGELT